MAQTRREFLKHAATSAAGLALAGAGFTAASYARIRGANDRIMVGVVGFSDRAKDALLPSFWKHADELQCEILGVRVFGCSALNQNLAELADLRLVALPANMLLDDY